MLLFYICLEGIYTKSEAVSIIILGVCICIILYGISRHITTPARNGLGFLFLCYYVREVIWM